MPQELMKEFIGKVCTIILFNESFGVQGKIVAVEENWIKVEEKNKVRLINVSEYPVKNADQFLGFICGVCSQDYDLQTMYVDSFIKVAGLEGADITDTILAMDAIGKQFNVNLVVSASIEEADLSDALKEKVVVSC